MTRRAFTVFFILISFASTAQQYDARTLINKMFNAIEQVKTSSFRLILHERIKDEYRTCEYIVKVNSNPLKLYVFCIKPQPGAEAIYIKGWNNDKAYINPNQFPYFNLSLSPYSMLLRKGHQYTLNEMGFSYIERVFKGYIKRDSVEFFSLLKKEPEVTWEGSNYYQLVIEKKDFQWVDYVALEKENLISISKKLMVNDYMLLERNPHIKSFEELKAGDKIKVPNAFGSKIILYLDKKTFLPMVQIVYDEKGLYGKVELYSFVLNPAFDNLTFSKDNPSYGY